MPEPQLTKRQRIVNELKLRLATIKTDAQPFADGYQYQTNLGNSPIDEWPPQYIDEDLREKTRVGIFDLVAKRAKEHRDDKEIIAELPLQVRIFHKRGTSPAELRNMIGDVMRAIVTNRETRLEDIQLNKLAVDVSPDEEGFIIPRDTFEIDGAAIGATVYYVAKPFQA